MKKVIFMIILGIYLFWSLPNAASDPTQNTSNVTSQAGNTTLLNFEGFAQTATWQGFFGQVSGGLVLEDGSGDNFYDWSSLIPQGEVLASRFIVADWTAINCTNQTEIYQEEERLGISNSSTDGINDTYRNTTHPQFEVAGRVMNGCRSTLTNNETADHVVFWNIILNANATTTIYTAIIDDQTIGFNGTAVDYQLLVPVNKSIGQSSYTFYLELD